MTKLSPVTCWYILICFVNGLVSSFLCLNNFPEAALFWSIQSALFAFSASFAHFFFLFLLVGFPFWLAIKFSPYKKSFAYLLLLSNILLVILVYLDTRIFELYKFHINGMVIELITGGALQDNLSFDALVWFLFLAIALLLIAVETLASIFIFKFSETNKNTSFLALLVLGTLLCASLLSQGIYIWSDAKGDITIISLKRYIPWAQTVTAKRKLRELGIEVRINNEQNLSYGISTLSYPKNDLTCSPEQNYNLLMLVVDSLRADMLSSEIMPNTWELAQKSHLYLEHSSLANSTRFGIFTLMYGLPGNYWHSMLGVQQGSVFVNELDKQGFQFMLHSAAPLYSPEFDRTVFAQTKQYINPAPEKTSSHGKDSSINAAIIKNLKTFKTEDTGKPFFGFVFYDSPHSYSYPKNFKEPFQPSWKKINYLELNNNFNPEPFLNRYKNSAAFTDSLLGEVYQQLEALDLMNNTIIVFTSDHGQEFNETKKNFWGHNGNFSSWQTQVPFLIYWPESHPLHGKNIFSHQTAHIDVVPTLMTELLQCTNPIKDYALGLNLYDSSNNYDRPLLMESWSKRAIVGKDYIMVSHDAGGKEMLNRDYSPKENFNAPDKDFSAILKQMSAFNKK